MGSSIIDLFLLYSMILLFNLASCDKLLSGNLGNSLGHSSLDAKYKIEFHSADSPYRPEHEQGSMIMPTKSGKKYLCYLPKVENPRVGNVLIEDNTTGMILKTEQTLNLKTPDELLEGLKGECLIRQEGWWTYELCFQKKLRQFHLRNNKVIQEFILGVYDADATSLFHKNTSFVKDGATQRYYSHFFTNGTLCDLTINPRETEVRFVCGEPRAKIVSITEVSTCEYAVTVQSPSLCKLPSFRQEEPTWRVIHCNILQSQGSKSNQISTLPINVV